jgi:pyruvate/2-oxoglutarate dehydrogenase complex dihydrolipoamide dehydrogenase (E3) component
LAGVIAWNLVKCLAFGSKVTIIERGDRLISKEDDNVSDTVADIMKSEAIELKFNAKEINVSDGNGISIKINGVDKEIKGTTRCRASPQYRYVTIRKP